MRQVGVFLSSFMRSPTPRINPVGGVSTRLLRPRLADISAWKSILNMEGVTTHRVVMVADLPVPDGHPVKSACI